MSNCRFCYNARVWAKEPHSEEDYFDEGLNDTNDFSSCTIGNSSSRTQMYINSGNGKAVNIEVCRWVKGGYRGKDGWVTVAKYYPKFCPECGRPLNEYKIDGRGTKYERL